MLSTSPVCSASLGGSGPENRGSSSTAVGACVGLSRTMIVSSHMHLVGVCITCTMTCVVGKMVENLGQLETRSQCCHGHGTVLDDGGHLRPTCNRTSPLNPRLVFLFPLSASFRECPPPPPPHTRERDKQTQMGGGSRRPRDWSRV
jgi:hypothetical protein